MPSQATKAVVMKRGFALQTYLAGLGAVRAWADTGAGMKELIIGETFPGNGGGVIVGQPGPTAARFAGAYASQYDGTDDKTDIYNAALNAALSRTAYTELFIVKPDAGIWTDITDRYAGVIRVNTSNTTQFDKTITDGRAIIGETAGGTAKVVTINSLSSVDWQQWAFTRDSVADEGKAYINAVQQGATLTGLGTWTGNIATFGAAIGAVNNLATPGSPWKGLIHLHAWFNRALTQAELATLVP